MIEKIIDKHISLFGDNPYNWILGLVSAGGFLLDSAIFLRV